MSYRNGSFLTAKNLFKLFHDPFVRGVLLIKAATIKKFMSKIC